MTSRGLLCPTVPVMMCTVTTDQARWKAVADAVRARREFLGPTQQEAAISAGIGTTVWGEIEGAKRTNYTPRILRRVAAELGWRIDSIDLILKGEDPVEIPGHLPRGVSYRQIERPSSDRSVADQIDEAADVIEQGVELVRQAAQKLREGK